MTTHQQNDETKQAMTKTRSRVSKSLIYISAFLLVTGLSVWWLYERLTFPSVRSTTAVRGAEASVAVPEEPASEVPSDACAREIKSVVGGVFQIAPFALIEKGIAAGGSACGDQLCSVLQEVKSGGKTLDQFYTIASSQDPCLNALLKAAVSHFDELTASRRPHVVFYDAESNRMSGNQVNALIDFLNKSVNKSQDRLLLVGHANALGGETINHNLARQRAEELIEKIKIKFSPQLQADFVYFGHHPPRMSFEKADAFGIAPSAFRNISFPGNSDPDFSLRLNQSIVIVPYSASSINLELP